MSSRPARAHVVGAGPNGLAAAITLAEQGIPVTVFEASSTAGGGCRTAELTLPGYRHDVCSTVQSMVELSRFFRGLDLEGMGVRMRRPEASFAQPLDGGRAAVAYADVERTVEGLGADGPAWRSLFGRLSESAPEVLGDVFSDLRHVPRHPLLLARFGLPGLLPATTLARTRFSTDAARALFAGLAAHSVRDLGAPLTSAFGLVLGVSAHASGWPVVEGGSGVLADALVTHAESLGVEFVLDHEIRSLRELPPAASTLLDIGPHQFAAIGGDDLPARYRRTLQRFRYGGGVFKLDYALSGPVPWTNPEVRTAGTVHLGGTLEEVAASEAAMEAGRHSERPYVLVVQAGVADPTRTPDDGETLWAYCHVPNGSDLDRTDAIEAQIERFAPGFRDLVVHRTSRTSSGYEAYDANYVGGDINAGRAGMYQSVVGPTPSLSRYATPVDGVYLCSSSTPPGGGVHGMCGWNAARSALARDFGTRLQTPVLT
ncbi:phytoene desaturase family protein [Jatrophihabitans sp. YIM 134969]